MTNKLSKHTKIWDFTSIIDSTIGKYCNISNNCEVYKAKIGDYTRIGFGCFICEGVTIGKQCFISPRVCFTNDKFPLVTLSKKRRKLYKTIIKDNVTIGANSTILPGITIGKNSIVGAGSVVTKNIPANQIWLGNPAKFYKKL